MAIPIDKLKTILLLAALVPGGVLAEHRFGTQVDTIRCGRELVKVGDSSYQLIDKCGKPDFRQVVQLNRFSDSVTTEDEAVSLTLEDSAVVVTEEWVYKQGRGRLVKILTLTGGVLTDIRLSDRQ